VQTSLISEQNGGSDFFFWRGCKAPLKENIKTKGMICEYIAFIVTLNIYIINYTAYYWNVLYDVAPYNT